MQKRALVAPNPNLRHALSFSQQISDSTTGESLVQKLGAIYVERQVAPDPRQDEGQTYPELLPSKGRVHHLQLALWQRQAVVPHQPHRQGLLAPAKPIEHLILHCNSILLTSLTGNHALERQDLACICLGHHELKSSISSPFLRSCGACDADARAALQLVVAGVLPGLQLLLVIVRTGAGQE